MSSNHHHLAQVNVARMVAPLGSEQMAGFVAQLPHINGLADRSPGFVWRLGTPDGATAVQAYTDPMVLINLSVWESVEALKQFTYETGHLALLRSRGQWFEKPAQAHLALWWIPSGHIPTAEQAVERLAFRQRHGDTAVAFSFAKLYPTPAEPSSRPARLRFDLDRRVLASRVNTPNGDASAETQFYYRQAGARVWATYGGGRVRFGSLVAVGRDDSHLDMRYHHVDPGGVLRTGQCVAKVELLSDGRVRLHEEWQWTNGDLSRGRSVVQEL
jgi:hypothetical protein